MGEKINFYRIRIISLFFLVIGIVLITGNMTGNAVLDYTLSDYCRSDLDCVNGKICCNIYGSPGFCNDAKICSSLEAFSMNLRESPLKKNYPIYTNIGFIFILSSIIIILFIYLHDHQNLRFCNGFRKILSKEFLGPKNPLGNFFGGETELKRVSNLNYILKDVVFFFALDKKFKKRKPKKNISNFIRNLS